MQGQAKCIGMALRLFKMMLRKLSVVYRFLPFCHHFFFDSTSSALESLQKKRSVASVAMSLGTFPWGKRDFLVIENRVLYIPGTCLLTFTSHHILCATCLYFNYWSPCFTFSFFVCIVTDSLKLYYLICHVIVGWSPVLEWSALFPSRSVW